MKSSKNRMARRGLQMALTAATLAPVSMTFAADKMEEVIVTAQFREQKLQDTPLAITAVTSEMIEQRSATNLADVANAAPSVVLRPASAAFGNSVTASIRGLGQIDFNPAYEPGVGMYIDDVYYPRLTGANFDMMDVERVEVLRGPQGTLTGRNSEGGAIKFITRKPTGDGGGYVSATVGSRNRMNLRASADYKLTDVLFGRLSGTFADQDGYVDVLDYGCTHPGSGVPAASGGTKCKQYSLGDTGYRALRGILRFKPSEKFDAMLSADYTRDIHHNGAEVLLYANNSSANVETSNGTPFDSRFICGKWCNYTTTASASGTFSPFGIPLAANSGTPMSSLEGFGVSLNMDIALSDTLQLNSISAYRGWEQQFSIDGDLSPANVQFGNNDLTHWFWSQELRLNAKFADNLNATFGGYYSDEQTTYYTLQDIRYAPIPLQFIGNDPVRTKSKALFTTFVYNASDALTLTAGLRYTKDFKSYTFYRYNLDGTTINPFLDPIGLVYGPGYVGPDTLDVSPAPGGNGDTGEEVIALTGRQATFRGSRTDYRLSVDYRFNPQVLSYVTISTGYKAGGVGPRPFNAAQARSFGPEKVTSYELGVKTDLFDRTLRLNAAVFYNVFKDAQLTLLSCPQFGGPGPCALPQNAGDAKLKGVEVEVTATPISGFQVDASASYIKWDWDCVNPAVVGLTSGPCSSDSAVVNRLSDTPRGLIKTKWNIGAQYEIGLGNSGTLTPRLDVNYQDKLAGGDLKPTADSPSEVYGQVPSYTLTNARLTWRNADKDLDVAMEITNLMDKYYYVSKFDLTGAGAGVITGSPGRPREWALTVKRKF